MRKRISEIEGSPIDTLKQINKLQDQVFKYFYFDSPFTRALRDYINKGKDFFFELPYEDCKLAQVRGNGPTSIGKVQAYSTQFKGNTPYEVDYFSLEFTVTFNSEYVGNEEVTKTYEVKVPLALEEPCSEEEFEIRFKDWIEKQKQDLYLKRKEKILKVLDDLEKDSPECKAEIQSLKKRLK
jgi:hypothetical protein